MTKLEQILSDYNKLHWRYTYGKKFKQDYQTLTEQKSVIKYY